MPSRKPRAAGDKPRGSIASWPTRGCSPPPCSRVSPVTRPGSAWTSTTVLVVQDTTSLNLTGCHVLPELGPIGSGNFAQGVLLHSTLALTEQGAVLGVLGLQTWARPAGNLPGPEAKESGKWLHGIDQARQVRVGNGLGRRGCRAPTPDSSHGPGRRRL